jgi:putative DNA primase/helicase
VLRAHPALEYWDGIRSLGTFPAMIALFHGAAGEPVTLHCTYLRADGYVKAPVPSPKKILGVPRPGATKGGAVRLFSAFGHTLGVAEGIESALSLHLIRKIPVWASFCADNLGRIRLPEGLRQLEIGVDMDENGKGQAVASALAKRVMRWSPSTQVLYIKPDLDGPGDLNDELRRRAG